MVKRRSVDLVVDYFESGQKHYRQLSSRPLRNQDILDFFRRGKNRSEVNENALSRDQPLTVIYERLSPHSTIKLALSITALTATDGGVHQFLVSSSIRSKSRRIDRSETQK
jgi:hypothetical protein